MKILCRAEAKIMQHQFDRIPKDIIEKKFIIDFFQKLPIEDLKRLIKFKETNFNNEELWRKSPLIDEQLERLRHERVILLEAEIWLDNGIDNEEKYRPIIEIKK